MVRSLSGDDADNEVRRRLGQCAQCGRALRGIQRDGERGREQTTDLESSRYVGEVSDASTDDQNLAIRVLLAGGHQ